MKKYLKKYLILLIVFNIQLLVCQNISAQIEGEDPDDRPKHEVNCYDGWADDPADGPNGSGGSSGGGGNGHGGVIVGEVEMMIIVETKTHTTILMMTT